MSIPPNRIFRDKESIFVHLQNKDLNISYPDAGNDSCFSMEENSFWFKHRNNAIFSILNRFTFENNFADIGGGNGFQLLFLKNKFKRCNFFLIEIGRNGCLNAKKRGLENIYNMPFQNFPFKENQVNSVGLFDVLEHIENDIQFLKELKMSLPEKSKIYITVPAHMFLWSSVDTLSGHFRRYTSKSLNRVAHEAGLKKIYNGYFFSYLTPILFLFRSVPYFLKMEKNNSQIINTAIDQHKVSAPISILFFIINSIEILLLKKFRLPIGASCIAVFET